MTPIKVPELLKPDVTIMYGYSGGMGLYVADWDSVLFLFQPTNVPKLSSTTIKSTPLN